MVAREHHCIGRESNPGCPYTAISIGSRQTDSHFINWTIFWDKTPCSPLSINRRVGETYRLHLQGRKNKFSKKLALKQMESRTFSTLKIETICSSETSVVTQRTTRRYIPDDGTLHNHRCENLKSYTIIYFHVGFHTDSSWYHQNHGHELDTKIRDKRCKKLVSRLAE
jgi:hypothetical protein